MMRLAISSTYPSATIKTFQPEVKIRQRITQVQIDRSGPLVEIDQSQCYGELGFGGHVELSSRIKERNYEKVLEGIGRLAWEGDQVMNRAGRFREEMIFSDLAKRRWDEKIPELNVRAAPSTRPKIQFHHEQSINWQPGGAEIEVAVRPPDIRWQMGEVIVDVRG